MINKKQFFAATARKSREVTIPGSDAKLTLRELTLAQREQVLALQQQEGTKAADVLALAVALSADCLDEADAPKMADDCSELVIMELSGHVLELSGMQPDAVEDAAKNSESGQS